MAKFCAKCGSQLPDETTLCNVCGARLSDAYEHIPYDQVHEFQKRNNNKVVKTMTYFGLTLLFSLPFFGFIACIIFATTSNNQNIKNYAKSVIIWLVIGAVIGGFLSFVIYSVAEEYMIEYANGITGSNYGSLGENFADEKFQKALQDIENSQAYGFSTAV